ncbi:hypothetical protein DSAG12_00296 [Promethearchaeum syntrophicum]|uniref:Uncharacterized protein n=1 Tax=Promethearchaeum syntrophicum TaxID=2594042 RepID=A0A5B9D664_9ARCH|nr:hypothetical protein [Candidatus Prometheoarchaeum syntrophicum]
MKAKKEDRNLESKLIQSDLNRFINSASFNLKNRMIDLNKSLLQKSMIRKNQQKLTQITLFEKDPKKVKISKNISGYAEFWGQFFPNIVNSHLALGELGILGITDHHSILDSQKVLNTYSIEFCRILPIISKLNTLLKKKQCDDVKISPYSTSILKIEPVDLSITIFLDFTNKIQIPSKLDSKKNFEKESPLKNWGDSYHYKNCHVLEKNFNDSLRIFIIEKESEYHQIIQQKIKSKNQFFFSIKQMHSLFNLISDFQSFNKSKINLLNISLCESNLKITLYSPLKRKQKQNWGLFLARKIEIEEED